MWRGGGHVYSYWEGKYIIGVWWDNLGEKDNLEEKGVDGMKNINMDYYK